MRLVGWLFGAVSFVLLGWIGGPVAMASYQVTFTDQPERARVGVADALLQARDRPFETEARLNLSIASRNPEVWACGYDPDIVLGDEKVPYLVSADWGYRVLRRREQADFKKMVRDYRAAYFARHHSAATMAGLTECLASPMARFCRRAIDRMIGAADVAEAKAFAESEAFARQQDHRIRCDFLDGAAKRRGIAKDSAAPKSAP